MIDAEALLAPEALLQDGRVQVGVVDGLALIHLNRHDKLNAFDADQIDAFHEAVRIFTTAPGIRLGVLCGGERAFCAGGDITTFDEIDVVSGHPYTRRGYDILRPIETSERPLIAAVDGWALAGGFEVALACDFIIAGEKAKFGFGELDLGLIPAYGGTVRLTRAISARVARQLVLTSERIGAERARELGLVNEIVAAGTARDRALEIANKIHANPPVATRVAKMASFLAEEGGIEGALAAERVGGALLFGTPDVHHRVREWSDKAAEKSSGS